MLLSYIPNILHGARPIIRYLLNNFGTLGWSSSFLWLLLRHTCVHNWLRLLTLNLNQSPIFHLSSLTVLDLIGIALGCDPVVLDLMIVAGFVFDIKLNHEIDFVGGVIKFARILND